MVQDTVRREIETLLESYGTEYWDDRDVTYDSLVGAPAASKCHQAHPLSG